MVNSDKQLTGRGESQPVKKQLLEKVKNRDELENREWGNRESKTERLKQMDTSMLFNHFPLKK